MDIAGKPLVCTPIQNALDCSLITQVFVSTIVQNIANAAKLAGAEVPYLRPNELVTDTSPNTACCLHLVDWHDPERNLQINDFILLQPTSPLLSSSTLAKAVKLFQDENQMHYYRSRSMAIQLRSI